MVEHPVSNINTAQVQITASNTEVGQVLFCERTKTYKIYPDMLQFSFHIILS